MDSAVINKNTVLPLKENGDRDVASLGYLSVCTLHEFQQNRLFFFLDPSVKKIILILMIALLGKTRA